MKFRLPGSIDAKAQQPRLTLTLKVEPRASASVTAVRAAPEVVIDSGDADLVEVELEGGVRLVLTPEALRADLEDAGPSRGAAAAGEGEDLVAVPSTLPSRHRSRGLGSLVIKALRFFKVDVPGSIVDLVETKVEGALDPGPGFYRVAPDLARVRLEAPGAIRAERGPLLVFVHGTASSTDGSFSGLWIGGSDAPIARLLEAHPGGVFALQHKTLTVSPIDNALDLAIKLPKGARVHLVTHSRGGLVGELLARGMPDAGEPFNADDLACFADPTQKSSLAALEQLNAELLKKELRIERFVRVACPARGTTLASRRLDRYLSVLFNLLERIPGISGKLLGGLGDLLAAVAAKRTDPSELPGLEAQMPESALIALLNRSEREVEGRLHVVGGDIEGEGFWSTLKVLATDFFYREDHDLVVHTRAMLGGSRRAEGVRYFIDTGSGVDHFSYFRNGDTARRVVGALTAKEDRDVEGMFRELKALPAAVTAKDYLKRSTGAPRPIVFLVPGIMGSHLTADGKRIWLELGALRKGGLEKLAIDRKNVLAEALIGDAYQELAAFLALSHDVRPFPYDWRLPIVDSAEQLRLALEAALHVAEQGQQPVRILAHSMGGLVARAMIGSAAGKKTWERMKRHPGARLVMLGTPNRGSYSIHAILLGRSALSRKIALLDFKHDHAELLEIVSRFDGLLQLLPHDGPRDWFDRATWEEVRELDVDPARGLGGSDAGSTKSADFAWPLPEAARLARAKQLRDLLAASPLEPDRMSYVAGTAAATACAVDLAKDAKPGRRVRILATAEGDGRVPWATGIPEELKGRSYFVDAEHGDLAKHEDAFAGYLELLTSGTTQRLQRERPVRGARGAAPFPYQIDPIDVFPDEADLLGAAMGGSGRRRDRESLPLLQVRVVHGDLAHAKDPVAVGHYEGDSIVSAEKYLDRALDGRLREHHGLGLYPGPIGTSSIFLTDGAPGRPHPGALVIGLGMVGELNAGSLARSVAQAVTAYGAELAERERARRGSSEAPCEELPARLAAVSIGTGAGGLAVADSVLAILRGVLEANRRFRESGAKRKIRVDRLELYELYEHRAIQTVKALASLGQGPELRTRVAVEALLRSLESGLRAADIAEEAAWWQRLRIEALKDGTLKFEVVTDRARVPIILQATQRRLVDRFLATALAECAKPRLGETLFELLVPNELKDQAPDQRNLVLVVDEQSAGYPWEILRDPAQRGVEPLSVRSGMIRQLATSVYRAQVRGVTEHRALVIGNPKGNGQDPLFSDLPGAEAEAADVARALGGGAYEVQSLLGSEAAPECVVTALFAAPYRIVHIAAHGYFEPKADGDAWTRSGVVLGDGLRLTPNEFRQLRHVPELVFLNCCHLGRMPGGAAARLATEQPQLFAASVGVELIRMGVRAVVVAGWEVDDASAGVFARTLYAELLAERTFGMAVQRARAEIYDGGGGDNTWGAYQCYGDPDFRLRSAEPEQGDGDEFYCAPGALRAELERLANRAHYESKKERERIAQRLERLERATPTDWLGLASIRAAFGRAFGEVADFKAAVRHYESACELEVADGSVAAMEQLASLLTRLGGDDKTSSTDRDRMFTRAQDVLAALLKAGRTLERQALLGSLQKRRARLASTREELHRALDAMARAYREAFEIGVARNLHNAYYPLENWLQAEIVLRWDAKAARGRERLDLKALLADLERRGRAAAENHDDDFWVRCVVPSAALLRAVLDGALAPAECQRVFELYADVARRSGSARELASLSDNARILARFAELDEAKGRSGATTRKSGKLPRRAALAQALHALADQLEQLKRG